MEKQDNGFIYRLDMRLGRIGKTRADLCKELGLSHGYFTYVGKNNTIPPGDICVKIAEYANCDVRWLIDGVDKYGLPDRLLDVALKIKTLPSEKQDQLIRIINAQIEVFKNFD